MLMNASSLADNVGYMLLNIPVPRAETGGFRRSNENISLFVVGPMNCHSESENFLKFLLIRANFKRFNPGDVSLSRRRLLEISAQGYEKGTIAYE
jgi:hypothetical protein